jgi:3-methyladenine DNA glycosylase AlkD
VNWALRQIGKRNNILKMEAIATANRILAQNYKSAKWIASNALNELIIHKNPF